MTGLETKFTQPGVALSDGSLIRGYASVFGVKDRGGDIVMPGAYAASL
jgi:phage head maturation protease